MIFLQCSKTIVIYSGVEIYSVSAMRLEGKVAIVTGAARGIGFAVSEAFLREGAKLMLCDINQDTVDDAVSKLKEAIPDADVEGFGFNVCDTEGVKSAVEKVIAKWSRIDVLVNNAGVTLTKDIMEMTDDDFNFVLNVNLIGPFKMIREISPIMKENGGGSIINTSSMVGTYGSIMQSAYSASKFGLNGLTKSCSKELGRFNIRVNAVAPGAVETDMTRNVSEKHNEAVVRMTPLKRMAKPEELATAYVYLASDESSFTNGAILNVDGGIVM